MSKAKSFAALKAEIARLEAQAAEARRRELAEVVKVIREKIVTYGLTAADLGFKGAGLTPLKAKFKASPQKKGATASIPKYRDPKTGNTWTGHGRAPNWLASAKNRDAFLIDSPAAAPSAATPVKKAAKKAAAAKKSPAKVSKPIKLAITRNVVSAAKKAPAKKAVAKKVTRVGAPAQPVQVASAS